MVNYSSENGIIESTLGKRPALVTRCILNLDPGPWWKHTQFLQKVPSSRGGNAALAAGIERVTLMLMT